MRFVWRWLFLGALILTGCTFAPQRSEAEGQVFVPPAVAGEAPAVVEVQPSPTPMLAAVSEARPTTPAECTNVLAFVADETIPDGTEVQPGEMLDKRWRVKNAGTCNWDGRYRLRHIAGYALGAPEEMALFPARAGTEVVVRIVFQAPEDPGPYFSTWQAIDPQGRPFGDPIYMQIEVVKPKPTATP